MKRALIVDDSRLARHVLSRLLAEHGVAADTAQSAEAALEYLKERRPDVVFLDHLMPGMDGFEALEAIKANPVTATIPVMMYTSQEGELYLGEARALGALGVLPKSLELVEVTKVLRSLRLIPGEPTPEAKSLAVTPTPDSHPLDTHRLREILEELFYEQGVALREEVRKSLLHAQPPVSPAPPLPLEVERRRAGSSESKVFKIAAALLVPLCVLLAYLYFATASLLEQATEQTRRLAADATALSTTSMLRIDTPQAPSIASSEIIKVLEWGVNQGGHYAFADVPLDDARADVFTMLFEQLEAIGFAGTVAIDVHAGRFCMNYASDGSLQLGLPGQPAIACEQIGRPDAEATTIGTQQSRAFANAVTTATARNSGLRVTTTSRGTSEPVVAYPPLGYEVTAGAWNAVAASNQRVVVRLEPETGTQP